MPPIQPRHARAAVADPLDESIVRYLRPIDGLATSHARHDAPTKSSCSMGHRPPGESMGDGLPMVEADEHAAEQRSAFASRELRASFCYRPVPGLARGQLAFL